MQSLSGEFSCGRRKLDRRELVVQNNSLQMLRSRSVLIQASFAQLCCNGALGDPVSSRLPR
jgi:hypothetical protein